MQIQSEKWRGSTILIPLEAIKNKIDTACSPRFFSSAKKNGGFFAVFPLLFQIVLHASDIS